MARNEDWQALKRIATVLFALGEVAERASARPRPILCLVLCLLRPAEALARAFVLDVSGSAALPAPVFDDALTGAGDQRGDALRLAAAFRLLAAALGALAAAGAASPALPRWRLLAALGDLVGTLAAPASRAPDTS